MAHEDRKQYRRRIAKNMRRWTDAKLDKENAFARGDETGDFYGWEWRAALDDEIRRRKVT